MNLQDTLYNWLSIKKVLDARPEDNAAKDTFAFFDEMLTIDHGVKNVCVTIKEPFYEVAYLVEDKEAKTRYPMDYIDALYQSIQSEPKFNNQC